MIFLWHKENGSRQFSFMVQKGRGKALKETGSLCDTRTESLGEGMNGTTDVNVTAQCSHFYTRDLLRESVAQHAFHLMPQKESGNARLAFSQILVSVNIFTGFSLSLPTLGQFYSVAL